MRENTVKKKGMAWIGKILNIEPIEGADKIERADVVCGEGGKWTGVVQKGLRKVEDVVVVFLPDSVVPEIPAFSFMERHKYTVKPMRLRGCPSEVVIMNPGELFFECQDTPMITVGEDVTDALGVLKYEKPLPASLMGTAAGRFPNFLRKTDEDNFQMAEGLRRALVGSSCYVATKYDGSSQTVWHRNGDFGACSRNLQIKEGNSAIWELVRQFHLEEKLAKLGNFAIQWEACGPGIQKNPMGLTEIEPRIFDVWDIDERKYLPLDNALAVVNGSRMRSYWVNYSILPEYQAFSDDELRKMAEGTYPENNKQREGIVIRATDGQDVGFRRISFKVLNLLYKH